MLFGAVFVRKYGLNRSEISLDVKFLTTDGYGMPNWIDIGDGMNVAFQSDGFKGLFVVSMGFPRTCVNNRV